jgi:hypothetical protein
MLLNKYLGPNRVMRPYCAIDFTMHLSRLSKALWRPCPLQLAVTEVDGKCFQERIQNWIAGGPSNCPVEPDIMNGVLMGIVEGRIHLCEFFG